MGLDTTHDCWHGAYSAFHRWRTKIAEVAGYPPLDSMQGFDGERSWDEFQADPLAKLLHHSDCDGSIAAADCGPIADRLAELVPLLPPGDGGGHIGDWRAKTESFINGLRRAAAAGEDVEFH